MKKLILFLSSLFVFVSIARANTYTNWQEEIIEGNNVETETRYRFYKEEEEGEYLSVGESNNYEYEDSNKYIYTNFSDYQNSCPKGDNYELDDSLVYSYTEVSKTRYIIISNNDKKLLFDRINVYVNGIEMKYKITKCTNCDLMFFTLDENGNMVLALNSEVETDKVSIVIANNNMEYANYNINLSTKDILDYTTASMIGNTDIINYQVDPSWLTVTRYDRLKYSLEPVKKTPFNIVYLNTSMCRYREKLTYHYNKKKIYFDNNYYKEIEDSKYIKDENDYKVYYRYLSTPEDDSTVEEIVSTEENINNNSEEIINTEDIIDYNNEKITSEEVDYSLDEEIEDSKELTVNDDIAYKKEIVKDRSLVNPLDIEKKNMSILPLLFIVLIMVIMAILQILKKKNVE